MDAIDRLRRGLFDGPHVCTGCGRGFDTEGLPGDVRFRCLGCGARVPDAAPATTIGRYRLGNRVGSGAMADVYDAEDLELRRRVAVKILHAADPSVVARFRREAEIAGRLQHPGIVGIHEIGSAGTRHFIAMDFVDGTTFADMLARRAAPRAELLRMIEDAARAMAHAHARGVVHRDLKPANILVERGGRVVVTDFGLARADVAREKLTHANAVMGTPHYMAPEQVQGRAEAIDARTDVYALGVILYETLTGRMPFAGARAEELYRRILSDDPTRPARIDRTVDADIELVCLRAIEKDQERRYATAGDFADDVARHRRGEPVLARPPSVLYILRKRLRRSRALIAAAATALALSIGAWIAVDAVRSSRVAAAAAAAERDDRLDEAAVLYERANAVAGRDRVRAEIDARSAALQSIDLALGRGLPRDAIDRAEALIRRAPRLARAHHLLALARRATGDFAGAEAAGRRAIALDEHLAVARYELARTILTRVMLDSVVRFADSSAAVPEDPLSEAASHLERVTAATGVVDPSRVALAAALLAHARGQSELCARLVDEAVARQAEGVEELLCLRGDWPQALRRNPSHTLARLCRAMHTHDRPAAAIADYSAALEAMPGIPGAWINRALLRARSGDLDGAIADTTRAIQVDPSCAPAWQNRSTWRCDRREFDAAIADADEAISRQPAYALAHLARGRALLGRGELSPAVTSFTRALEIDPRSGTAFEGRAQAHLRSGNLDAAIADGSAAIALSPTSCTAYANRGMARLRKRDHAGAAQDFEKALDLAPADWPSRPQVREWLLAARQ
jgi:tetratricopeptide (TPR) repeat protein